MSEEYKIEKGVPIPKAYRTGTVRGAFGTRMQASLREMAVNDSMLITYADRFGLSAAAKQVGIMVTSRKTDDGIRVWRVA